MLKIQRLFFNLWFRNGLQNKIGPLNMLDLILSVIRISSFLRCAFSVWNVLQDFKMFLKNTEISRAKEGKGSNGGLRISLGWLRKQDLTLCWGLFLLWYISIVTILILNPGSKPRWEKEQTGDGGQGANLNRKQGLDPKYVLESAEMSLFVWDSRDA